MMMLMQIQNLLYLIKWLLFLFLLVSLLGFVKKELIETLNAEFSFAISYLECFTLSDRQSLIKKINLKLREHGFGVLFINWMTTIQSAL